jgi:Ti-type conjugative transfer relaxase TraA
VAIYHLSAKIVTRAKGQSVVASAAYRSASHLYDGRIQQTFDYTRKGGVEHKEILAPREAPDWVHDRQALWNAVEKVEKRKDAQLAREIELALPVELGKDEQVELLREFAQRSFVSNGMVVDLAIHRDNPENPHAHLLLTTREITPGGFGPKRRDWNAKEQLLEWRAEWAATADACLARAGPDVRIDHRSLEAQGIDLAPGRKIGVSQERQALPGLPNRIADRVAEQRRIASENGERILADPRVALTALTHHQATFTDHDLAKFLHTRTEGAEQFRAAHLTVTTSRELVVLGKDDRGRIRYTSREMLAIEQALLESAGQMAAREAHPVTPRRAAAALSQHPLSDEQRAALAALIAVGDLKSLVGVAGSGKSRLLAAARETWEAEGYTVKGAALSGIAAENLTLASGIESRTLASLEYTWTGGRDSLTARDVLVIDEAGMLGTRQLARVLEAAEKAQAKVVLVGDPEQLQAIEAGAAFRGILAETGVAELSEVRRQAQAWQREATQDLSTGHTVRALVDYERRDAVTQLPTRSEARAKLLERWAEDGERHPQQTRLILAYTRADVAELNDLVRVWRREHGELKRGQIIETERGPKEFAAGERLYFLRNERSLGVKNGSLGTIEKIRDGVLDVKLDATGDRVVVDTKFYRDLDYGHAATVYKAQGATVDRTYVLATWHYDRHATYVALSRHRHSAEVFYAAEDFQLPWARKELSPPEARQRFLDMLSRARPKELAHDYLDRDPTLSMETLEAAQQRAAEQWIRKHLAGGFAKSHAAGTEHQHSPELDRPDLDL